jgi:hypothetical protein
MAKKIKKNNGCTITEALPEYCLEIVGDDVKQAKEIKRALKKGIERAADICKMRPPVCKENLGLTRDRMPQITGDANVIELLESDDKEDRAKGRAILQAGGRKKDTRTIQQQFLDYLEDRGVKTRRKRVRVGQLKATQAEIKAAKAFGMADAHLRGDFPTVDKQILISKDGHILDGHHRWAALLTIDPGRFMSVLEIGLPMAKSRNGSPTVLGEAAAFPGVYKASFDGAPLPAAAQKRYKQENKSQLSRSSSPSQAPKAKSTRGPTSSAAQRRATAAAIKRMAGV